MNTPKLLSTREWILIILLLMIAQALIHFWSTETMSSSQIVNYISFAGTIVSIILAVLAIVYSFYQSFSQQNNVDSISREVDNLKETAKKVSESAHEISSATSYLPKIMDDVVLLPRKINEAVEQVISDRTKILLDTHSLDLKAYFKAEFDRSTLASDTSLSDGDSTGKTISAAPYEITYVINALSAYRIMYFNTLDELYIVIRRVFSDDLYNSHFLLNATNAMISSFISTGLLTFNDGKLFVNDVDFVKKNMADYIFNALSSLERTDLEQWGLAYFMELKNHLLHEPYDMETIRDRISQIIAK
ncbi:hypothetical protein ACK327_01510 [Aeromonas dhakensis]|uniref:hypothetical protein n=1 Tax=Aeromonas dhakensis TaxID=196024 RepID=UPI00191CAB94|nr:hypothetical protein [Aeromonas dhakensis]MBL0675243.1 hypothetical protein [Aeromonas dhakensis]